MAVLTLKSDEVRAFPKLVRDFAAHKSVMDNCTEKTVCEYLYDLRTFFRFLIAERENISTNSEKFTEIDISKVDIEFIRDITESDVYSFLNFVAGDRQNGWSARSRKLTSIKSFFSFLTKKKKLLEKDPTSDLSGPKKQTSLPKFLSFEESLQLLNAIRLDGESKTVVRDYCIVTLFLNCGMRLSELVGIDLTDLKPGLSSLIVTGKGRKERIVYLNDACKKALMDYIVSRQAERKRHVDTTALFVSSRGERISNKTVQQIVYKYLDKAGLGGRGFSVHKLRHTAATLMYQSGNVDVRVLKDILGHEQLNTTQIYTHVSNAGMARAMEENPLSQVSLRESNKKDQEK